MAVIITIQVLSDDNFEGKVDEELLTLLSENSNVIDCCVSGFGETNSTINELLEKGLYEQTDAFKDMLLYSASKNAYWSNEMGWVQDFRAATHFKSTETVSIPNFFIDNHDAKFVLDED